MVFIKKNKVAAAFGVLSLTMSAGLLQADTNTYTTLQLVQVSDAVYLDGNETGDGGSTAVNDRHDILNATGLQERFYTMGPDDYKVGEKRGLWPYFTCKADWEAMLVDDQNQTDAPLILAFAGSDFPDDAGGLSAQTGDACDFYATSQVTLKPLQSTWNELHSKNPSHTIDQPALIDICGDDCEAHEGVIAYVYSLWYSPEGQTLRSQINSLQGNRDLVVTGHSLGGAVAQLYTMVLAAEENAKPISNVVTFGSFLVGNQDLADTNNALGLTAASTHFVNDGDPIPRFPLDNWHACTDIFGEGEDENGDPNNPSQKTACNLATTTDYDHDDEERDDPNSHYYKYQQATNDYFVPEVVLLNKALFNNEWQLTSDFTEDSYNNDKDIDVYHTLAGTDVSYDSQVAIDINSDLLVHLKIDSNTLAGDSSGNGLDGSMVGGELTTDRAGNENSAYQLGGNGDRIEILHHPLFDTWGNGYTWTGWVKRDVDGGHQTMMAKFNSMNLIFHKSYNKVWPVNGSMSDFSVTTADDWTHVAFTVDAEGQRRFYKNGVLSTNSPTPGSVMPTGNNWPVRFGTNYGGSYSLQGSLDDIRMYSRTLNDEEIEAVFTLPAPTAAPIDNNATDLESDLLVHLDLDGNGLDSSGNGLHGDLIGGTLVADQWGNPNSAYQFGGSGDMIEIPHDDLFNTWGNGYTWAGWVKREVDGGHQTMMAKFNSMNLIFHKSYHKVWPVNGSMSAFTVKSTDGWTHVAITVDANGDRTFYKNGLPTAATAGTPMPTGNNSPVRFGSSYSGGSSLIGTMDDIRIYARTLNHQEISELSELTN
ncbi:hypothetical protein OAV62_00445 [bacterium]|nr:hypothetical protein [bacterium]